MRPLRKVLDHAQDKRKSLMDKPGDGPGEVNGFTFPQWAIQFPSEPTHRHYEMGEY